MSKHHYYVEAPYRCIVSCDEPRCGWSVTKAGDSYAEAEDRADASLAHHRKGTHAETVPAETDQAETTP